MRRTKLLASTVVLLGSTLAALPASAALIDFEEAPQRGLSDDDPIGDAYAASYGVTFNGGFLEDASNQDPNGFYNRPLDTFDVGNAAGLGTYFLRTGGGVNGRGPGDTFLSVDFSRNTVSISGQIWDIDGNQNGSEQWEVTAWMDSQPVGSVLSPRGTSAGAGTLDGRPWAFDLNGLGSFDRLTFDFVGTKTQGIGLAFDNFETGVAQVPEIPEPQSIALLGVGLLGLGWAARRRTNADDRA